jgi:hypothetical protein
MLSVTKQTDSKPLLERQHTCRSRGAGAGPWRHNLEYKGSEELRPHLVEPRPEQTVG